MQISDIDTPRKPWYNIATEAEATEPGKIEIQTEKENTKMKETTIQKIIEYFEENESVFNSCIEELDSYNGYLGDNRYYDMEMLNEFYCNAEPTELLNRAFFGHDENTWTNDSYGNKSYGAFNPNRDYFTYNGYGNLVSTDYKDYSAHLDRYAIEDMSEHRDYIDTIESDDELAALFDELEAENNDEI